MKVIGFPEKLNFSRCYVSLHYLHIALCLQKRSIPRGPAAIKKSWSANPTKLIVSSTDAGLPPHVAGSLAADMETLERIMVEEQMRIERQEVVRRFGLLQSRLRKQTGTGVRESGPERSDEGNPRSSRTSMKQQLTSYLGKILVKYGQCLILNDIYEPLPPTQSHIYLVLPTDPFLQSQNLRALQIPLRSVQRCSLAKFLVDGPSVRGKFDEPLWITYDDKVEWFLLDPKSRSFLEQDASIFLDEVDLIGEVGMDDSLQEVQRDTDRPYDEEAQMDVLAEMDRMPFGWHHLCGIVNYGIGFFTSSYDGSFTTARPPPPPEQLHGRQPDGEDPVVGWSSAICLRIRSLLLNRLFTPLAMTVWISNIATAFGYVMLMNDPAPPKSSYIIG